MATLDPGSVRLALHGGAPSGVELACSRPDVAARLVGMDGEQAASFIPLVFSICAQAQGLAARLALAAARGIAADATQDRRAAAEAAREHAWRLGLDWPALLGLPVDRASFVALASAISRGESASWSPPAWVGSLEGDGEDAGAPVSLLPSRDATQTLADWPFVDEAFAHAPDWRGRPAETGAYARRQGEGGHGLRARVAARAKELQDHLQGRPTHLGFASAVPVAPGVGRSVVETARGMLLHEIALDGARISRYIIVAPTEWNFRQQGPLAMHLMAGLEPRAVISPAPASWEDRARALAGAWVLALDPCVPWTLEIT